MSILVELDEKIVSEIDAIAGHTQKKRNACVNELLRKALRQQKIEEKERRAVESYRRFPVQPDEFEVEEEQLIEAWKDL
ncbi:MAG: hypothetical protein LH614_04540 [Pyrinomonadaceae bacterium]|nr:hypothetical protein [Pyrinomonadaceae bacterium]